MPLIKARTSGIKSIRHSAHIFSERMETLHAWAAFLSKGDHKETTDYVINEALALLEEDKDYRTWRKDHPEVFYKPEQKAAKSAKKRQPAPLRQAV